MPDSAHFQQLVQTAVQQALEQARADVTARVMQAIAPALAPPDDTERLAAAVRTIDAAYAQTDILGALLHACSEFASRCAVFVARGVSAPIWQASGFGDGSAIRGISAQVATGLGATATQTLAPVQGSAADFDARFISAAGAPADGKCSVLPLIVREKVAALVYADAGSDGKCDAHALEILVRAAGNRIEIAATRKSPTQTGTIATASPVAAPHVATAPAAPVVSHAVALAPTPAHTFAASTAAAPAMAPQPAMPPTHATHVQTPTHAETAASNHQAPSAAPADELQVKARRFAKLLVDEIKLYNQQEVAAGKQAGNLYDRLREPIDKSREAYDRRYGNTAAAAGNYFMNELVRILADNNIVLMGANFPR